MMIFPLAIPRYTQVAATGPGAGGGATAPAQFAGGDWSVADAGTSGDIVITITALPSNGGSAITDLEYQIDGGSWVSLAGTSTGAYPVSGLTDDVEVDVAIRAVNAIGNGTASATKAVTPTGVATDPNFANVVLLVSFDGSNGATTATDASNSGHTLTFNGDAKLATDALAFGATSLALDGVGDNVTIPNSADFQFGSGQFTVEGWVRRTDGTNPAQKGIVALYETTGNQRSWGLEIINQSLIMLHSTAGSSGTITGAGGGTDLASGSRYHVCLERGADNILRCYTNGSVMLTADLSTNALFNSTTSLTIGSRGSIDFWVGNIDELRITKGVARYGGAFTPPSAAFPRA